MPPRKATPCCKVQSKDSTRTLKPKSPAARDTRQKTLFDLVAPDITPPPLKATQPLSNKKRRKSNSTAELLQGQQTLSAAFRSTTQSQDLNLLPLKRRVRVKCRAQTRATTAAAAQPATQGELHGDAVALLALELSTIGATWLPHLMSELQKPYFLQLKVSDTSKLQYAVLDELPVDNLRYQWSRLTPLQDVKVVILGSAPYGEGQIDEGLAYSVRLGEKRTPVIDNIFAELACQIPGFVAPSHGNLSAWARRGVLLLNICQAVELGKAGSTRMDGWRLFNSAVINAITSRANGVVFMAWGSEAANQVSRIDRHKHLVLTSAHPSPSSARRGFFGNGHFRIANAWLAERYGQDAAIEWESVAY